MKKNLFLATAVVALTFASGTVYAETKNTGEHAVHAVSAEQKLTPEQFLTRSMHGNMFEVAAGEVALSKTKNDKVKEFAQMMVDDHTQAKENLSEAIEESDISAKVPGELSEEHAAKLEKLKAADGAAFDALYIEEMKQAHTKTLSLLTSYTRFGKEGPLKDFAANALKTVTEHHEKVNAMTL